jgi:LysM repeat protein
VEKVAERAGRAAPAVAVAGALAVAPQIQNLAAHTSATVAERVVHAHLDAVELPAHHVASVRHYTVRPGDTLSIIAERFYGNPGDWRWLFHVNRAEISNPNMIFAGQVLRVPHDPPASVAAHHLHHGRDHGKDPDYKPRHARRHHHAHHEHGHHGHLPHGTLGCHGLERLWVDVGGAPWAKVTAASVAMAESGGNQYAISPTDDIGYWQINRPSWGAWASTAPGTNARAAVRISSDGTDWSPWTTYRDGAYAGRC